MGWASSFIIAFTFYAMDTDFSLGFIVDKINEARFEYPYITLLRCFFLKISILFVYKRWRYASNYTYTKYNEKNERSQI